MLSSFRIPYHPTTYFQFLLLNIDQSNSQSDSLIEFTFICYHWDTSYSAVHMPGSCYSASGRWWNLIKQHRLTESHIIWHFFSLSLPFCLSIYLSSFTLYLTCFLLLVVS